MADAFPIPPKVPLILAPTPLHRLNHLSEALGIDLWIKRDDLTGFAMGGNKGRKLEYLIADALRLGAEAVVTCGSAQSNFIRQLGAACSMHRLKCAAAAMALPFCAQQGRPDAPALTTTNGNALLEQILGVDVRILPDSTWEDLYEQAEALACEYEAQGYQVYRIPIGGSTALGAYAFYQAGLELQAQAKEPFDSVVFASSSGSTQTGLTHAFHGTGTLVQGISCDPEPQLVEDFVKLSRALDELAGHNLSLGASDFMLDLEWVGPGYGVPSEAGDEAIQRMARAEGIFLDPVYSGKAFAGLIGLAQSGKIGNRVLFWHTGGAPALFASPTTG